MSLSSTTSRNDYQGADSVGPFAYGYRIFAATDLEVTKRSLLGVETRLAYPADYAVAGVGNRAGGTVTLTAALAAGETLTIRRVPAITQPTDLRNAGAYFPETLEDQFDRLAMIDQSQQDALDRALRLPVTLTPGTVSGELPVPGAGQALFWNDEGTAIENRGLDGGAVPLPASGRLVATLADYLEHNAVVNVLDFAADGTGTGTAGPDWTTVIQGALNANARVVIPAHATLRVDGTITVGEMKTLHVLGRLQRYAAHSASTRPVVRVQGDYGAVLGGGVNSAIATENASPDGILLYGVESPIATAASVAIRWFEGRDLQLVGKDNSLANKGLALQTMEPYGVGALYDGHFHNFKIFNVGRAIYLNSDANGNTFDLINCWNVRRAVDIAGDAEGAFLTTDVNVSNLFVDNSPDLECIVRARRCQHTALTNINGEPGVGRHHDIDATCSRITLTGADNCPTASIWAPALSAKIVNGVLVADTASIANLSATAGAATTQVIGGRLFEYAADLGVVAGAGGTKTFDFVVGGAITAYVVDVTVMANHGGFGNQNSAKRARILFCLFADALNQNVTAGADPSDSVGYTPASIGIALTAVGAGSKVRITISNAHAAEMGGSVAFRFVGAYATPTPA